jgi:hypothetical protein
MGGEDTGGEDAAGEDTGGEDAARARKGIQIGGVGNVPEDRSSITGADFV